MELPKNLSERLIYLDPGFISLLWEEETGQSPSMKISNDLGFEVKASVGIGSFGSGIKETRSYEISTLGMLKELATTISKYPKFDPEWFLADRFTRLCWLEGTFSLGEWRSADKSSTTFELYVENENHTLVVQRDLFRASIGQLVEMDSGVSLNVDIPVSVLGLVLFKNPEAQCHVTSPYLIFTRSPE